MNKALHALAKVWLTLILVAIFLPAQAEQLSEALSETAPLCGTIRRPVGVSALQAAFSLEYAYPQFEAVTSGDSAVNAYFCMLASQREEDVDEYDWQMERIQVKRSCEVTHVSPSYICVVESVSVSSGNGESESLVAHTLSRFDCKVEPLGLTRLLEQQGIFATADVVAETVCRLVYEIALESVESAEGEYLEGLTLEQVGEALCPETDFYLDQDGNVVFYIGAGEIAGEIAGILRFPFAMAELANAINEKEIQNTTAHGFVNGGEIRYAVLSVSQPKRLIPDAMGNLQLGHLRQRL